MPIAAVQLVLGEIGTNLRNLSLSVAADEWCWDEFEVDNGASDSDIFPQNITTINILYLESSKAVTWEADGADTRITLNAGKFALLFGTSITALTISNASGSTSNIKLGWFGT